MDKYTQPVLDNSALITIDVLRDTLDKQPLEIPGTSTVLPKIKQLMDFYRENNKPIVHIIRIYKTDASNVDLCRKKLVLALWFFPAATSPTARELLFMRLVKEIIK